MSYDQFGEVVTHSLKPNGDRIPVTNENRNGMCMTPRFQMIIVNSKGDKGFPGTPRYIKECLYVIPKDIREYLMKRVDCFFTVLHKKYLSPLYSFIHTV